MADIKVKDLTDTQTINTDNEIMVLTNKAQNQVQNITVGNLLSNVLSSDNDNVLEQGTDGKLYVETPENITGDLSDLSTTEKSSLVAAINEVDGDITTEATTRANADNNLQSQIDAITAASDVTDIVGTYAELQAYDTTGLANNSIIKVLQDESRQDETAYYRWVITGGVGAWVLIGEEGPYYTKSQSDSKFATQETVGNLNNLTTSDKSSVVNAMNELASVLDPTQTADYIKNSKAIYSGEISENALILPQIKEMAHSTFDLSKFTVVGSPNITDDGIASGFSGSNTAITTYYVDFSKTNWEITTPVFKISNISAQSNLIIASYGDNTNPLEIFVRNNGKISWNMPDGSGTNTNIFKRDTTTVLDINTYYQLKMAFDGTVYKLYLSTNGSAFAQIDSYTSSVAPNLSLLIQVGRADTLTGAYVTADLKQFSITVDGVEVFSGNKTGIDTIKPDDYTVVGTPTISADGIASGFTTSNYLKTTKSYSQMDSFKFSFSNIHASAINEIQYLFSCYAQNANDTYIQLRLDATNNIRIGININAQNVFQKTWAYSEYISGEVECKDGVYTGTINGVTQTLTDSRVLPADTYLITIGLRNSMINPATASKVDLNSLKLEINGNLVYQPCLKIPYTESFTGSKITQSIYRDRVWDMYEQFGYAPYYTLSDTDFTLPQGELYGYLEKRARDIAHPIAQPFYRFSDEINEDEVRLEGAEVDKGLYLAIEQNLSAYCTAGSTSDKICLPDFRDRVPWGANTQGYIEAGLPNITGSFQPNQGTNFPGGTQITAYVPANYSNGLATGAFDIADKASGDGQITFDASRSSSIYNDNVTTVQPPAFKVRWIARYK